MTKKLPQEFVDHVIERVDKIMSKNLIGELIPQEYCIATVYHKDFPDDPQQCSRTPQGLQVYCWQHEKMESWKKRLMEK